MCSPCLNCLCDGSNLIHLASFCKSNCPHAFLNAPAYISLHHFTTLHMHGNEKKPGMLLTLKNKTQRPVQPTVQRQVKCYKLSREHRPIVFWACRSSLQQQCVAGTNLQGLQFRRKDSRTILVAKAMLGRRYDFLKMKRYEEIWRDMKSMLFSFSPWLVFLKISLAAAFLTRVGFVTSRSSPTIWTRWPTFRQVRPQVMDLKWSEHTVLMPCTNFLSCGLHVLHIVTMSTQMSAFVASTM